MTTITTCYIDVEFEAPAAQVGNYQFTIFWGVQGVVPQYPNQEVINLTPGGAHVWTVEVPCPVNCDPVIYEGYIDGCEANDVPFTIFVSDGQNTPPGEEDCYKATWECVSSPLDEVVVDSAGAGYTINDVITISGGGGSGATAEIAVVNGTGGLNDITLLTSGSGYTSLPTITVSSTTGVNGTLVGLLSPCPTLEKGFCGTNTDPTESINVILQHGTQFSECTTVANYNAKKAALTPAEVERFGLTNATGLQPINCFCEICKRATVQSDFNAKDTVIAFNACTNSVVDPSLPAGSLIFATLLSGQTLVLPCQVADCDTITDMSQQVPAMVVSGSIDCS
jgi:hypothetical protein